MTLLYNFQIRILQIIEYLQYKRCKRCNEITIDNECDFCESYSI